MSVEIRKYVGNRIREYKKSKKMTQKYLGDKIGVRHNTISSYENGTNETELDILFKIADVLERPIDDFFPSKTNNNNLERALKASDDEKLSADDLMLIKEITEKALELEGEERKKLMSNIKFAVNFFDQSNE